MEDCGDRGSRRGSLDIAHPRANSYCLNMYPPVFSLALGRSTWCWDHQLRRYNPLRCDLGGMTIRALPARHGRNRAG